MASNRRQNILRQRAIKKAAKAANMRRPGGTARYARKVEARRAGRYSSTSPFAYGVLSGIVPGRVVAPEQI